MFKEFTMMGSLVDIAVTFVMRAAFKDVVTSFTSGFVSPVIGLVFKAGFKAGFALLRATYPSAAVHPHTGARWL